MRIDTTLLQTFADVFINLSAGWFGVAFIVPKRKRVKLSLLTTNIAYGILCLIGGFLLRKIGELI